MCFLAAVPTYPVVVKSAKKGSTENSVEEQKPQTEQPQNSALDKSKKKKKMEEPDTIYAQVNIEKLKKVS